MIEDEDVYRIVSLLLESESDSDDDENENENEGKAEHGPSATTRIGELERQVSLLRTANSRLKGLALDIQRNPSRYEGRSLCGVFDEIESGADFLPKNLPGPPATTDSFAMSVPQQQQQQQRRRSGSNSNSSNNFDGCGASSSLYDYKGSIVSLSKYQPGCRFIQRQLDAAKSRDEEARLVKVVLDEVMPSLAEVLTDTYGQYLVPNVVAHCSGEQRAAIIEAIEPDIFELACNTYGSHGLQKMLAHLSDAEAEMFGRALDRHVLALSKDPKGNYILQTYLKTFGPGPRVQFIVDRLCEHIRQVSTDKVGCTVVCKCVENGSEEQRRQVVLLVAEHAYEFVQDQFANYVVQDVLNVCGGPLASLVARRLYGRVAPLCFQKFSSNVVEKCLEAFTGQPEFERLYDEIVGSEAVLKRMLQDPYGNFVVQKLLDTSNAAQHERLTRAIAPLIKDIKTSQYAVHIHKKLNRQN